MSNWHDIVNVVGEFLQTNNFHHNIGGGSYSLVAVYVLWSILGIWFAGHIFNKEVKDVTIKKEDDK